MMETHHHGLETSPESVEASEKTASAKYDKLKNLDHYGVRFVNQDEYKGLLDGSGKIGEEAYWVGHQEESIFGGMRGCPPVSFATYATGKKSIDWASTAATQANWDRAMKSDLVTYADLIGGLRKAHRDSSGSLDDKRQETLKKYDGELRKKAESRLVFVRRVQEAYNFNLAKYIGKYGQEETDRMLSMPQESRDPWMMRKYLSGSEEIGPEEFRSSDRRELIEAIISSKLWLQEISADSVKVLEEFCSDPDYLLQKKENLRKIVNTIAYMSFDERTSNTSFDRQSDKHYHMAVIIDDSAFERSVASKNGFWGILGESFDPAKHILGAIAVMGNKELAQEMIDISSHAGDAAHPIFATNGIAVWPKQKNGNKELSDHSLK